MGTNNEATNPKTSYVVWEQCPRLALPEPPYCYFNVLASKTTAAIQFLNLPLKIKCRHAQAVAVSRTCTLTPTTSTPTIYRNTVSFGNNSGTQISNKAATPLSSIFSLFWTVLTPPMSHCYLWTLYSSPALFTTSAFRRPLCAQGLLFAGHVFLPSHLTSYFLLKGKSVHLKNRANLYIFSEKKTKQKQEQILQRKNEKKRKDQTFPIQESRKNICLVYHNERPHCVTGRATGLVHIRAGDAKWTPNACMCVTLRVCVC